MRRHRGKGSKWGREGGLAVEFDEVTPPDLESEPEPELESDEEPDPQAVGPVVHEPAPPPDDSESEGEQEEASVAAADLEMPRLVPMALGNKEFTVSMRRVEVEPDNYIWSVKLVRDGEEVAADSDCSLSDDLLSSLYPVQDNPT